jgi:hypothetical protein
MLRDLMTAYRHEIYLCKNINLETQKSCHNPCIFSSILVAGLAASELVGGPIGLQMSLAAAGKGCLTSVSVLDSKKLKTV